MTTTALWLALMLGAAGVLVGTRFYATEEALGADAAKARIVEASGDETVRGKAFDIVRQTDWPESPSAGSATRQT